MALTFPKSYVIPVVISPGTTGLQAGAVLFSVRNAGADVIHLKRFAPTCFFTGTVAGTVSVVDLQRAVANPSGGTPITPVMTNPAASAGSADARFSNTGLTATPNSIEIVKTYGQPSQNVVLLPPPLVFEDENLLQFAPGQCLLIVASNNLVAGVRIVGDFIFYEGTGG